MFRKADPEVWRAIILRSRGGMYIQLSYLHSNFLSERTEKKAFVTVACGGRDQRQMAFGPAVVTDVAGTFCNPCVRARQHQIGAGGGNRTDGPC
jgi:hypothetical protein